MEPTSAYLTYDREINVLDADSFTPIMEEIFIGLPKINRFNGQTSRPYSVALHSVMCCVALEEVYEIVEPHLQLAMLLHDAGETYIGDIVRPIKQKFNGGLYDLEDKILHKIYLLCEFSGEQMKDIYSGYFQETLKEIDTRMAATEADHFRVPEASNSVLKDIERFHNITYPETNSWKVDEQLFRLKFEWLMGELKK